MRSKLTIIEPAADLALLTIEEMRAAAGITGTSDDAALSALEHRVAAAIMTECRVAIGRNAPPTLLRERCEERFRLVRSAPVFLARRHEIEIVSVAEDGNSLADGEYDVDPESGELVRLASDLPVAWACQTLTVVYDAGFEDVPADLKMGALDFFRLAWLEARRDPSLKVLEEDVDGVLRTRKEFWVGAIPGQSGEGAVPAVVSGQLARFVNWPIA